MSAYPAGGPLNSSPVGQRPTPKPRTKLPSQVYDDPKPIYDVPRPVYDVPRPISQTSADAEQPQPVVLCNRSESFTSGQRPQPKPKKGKACSVMFGGTASADSSPQVPRPENKRMSMQPNPLIQALSGQLLSQLRTSEEMDQTGDTPPNTTSKRGKLKQGKKDKLKFWSISPVFRRSRVQSSSKSKTSPTKLPTSNERSSTFTASQQVTSPPNRKSNTLPANLRYASKHGSPVPNRPAPLPPYDKTSSSPMVIDGTATVYEELDKDKTGNDYVEELVFFEDSPTGLSQTKRGVRKPLGGALPPLPPRSTTSTVKRKHRLLGEHPMAQEKDIRKDTTKTRVHVETEQDTGMNEPVRPLSQDSDTSGEESGQEPACDDGTHLVYEDLGRDYHDDYPTHELVVFGIPAGPPTKGSAREALPQLLPRSTPPTVQQKHPLLSSHQKVSAKEEEAQQDTGIYEPVNFPSRDSDSEDVPNSAVFNADGTCPVYEDLEKEDECGNDYMYSTEPTCAVASNQMAASPALPPKRGSGEDILPQLPPRSTQPVAKRKHRLLQTSPREKATNDPAQKKEEQNTRTYKALSEESSDDSDYTPMGGGKNKGEAQLQFEDDDPESMYIEMQDNVHVQFPWT